MRVISCFHYFVAIPCNLSNLTIKQAQVQENGKTRYHTGETLLLGCQISYKSVGNGSRECYEGHWTTQDFFCESEYSCIFPFQAYLLECDLHFAIEPILLTSAGYISLQNRGAMVRPKKCKRFQLHEHQISVQLTVTI